MWLIFARIIIRKRIFILCLLLGLTAWFAYSIKDIQINRELTDMLPPDHPDMKVYKDMHKLFGQDGMVMVVAVQDKNLYKYDHFRALYDMGNKLRKINGVDSVFSEASMYALRKDSENKKFVLGKTMEKFPANQAGVDSIKQINRSLPFYEYAMFNPKTNTSLVLVFLNADKFNSADRGDMVTQVVETAEPYAATLGDLRYSGLPIIRDTLLNSLRDELTFFVILSVLVSAVILYLFFRSLRALFICMVVILIGLIWSFGSMAILGFKITTMMSLIPPLMIVIGIPNCIYLINKYHQEYVKARNKMKALTQVIHKLGVATFITNANTALGFLTFVFTGNHKLIQFGIISSINVMAMFFVSLTLIPIIYTFMAPPTVKHVKHLDKKWTSYVIEKLVNIITYHRKLTYTITIALTAVGVWGIFQIKTTGNIASDLPSSSDVVNDLKFLENQFGGVMPMAVVINTHEKGQILKEKTLQKIDSVQRLLATDKDISKSVSVVDAAKFINQAFRGGYPEDYTLVSSSDKIHIAKYIKNSLRGTKKDQFKSFIDSSETVTRITANMADIGTLEIIDKQEKLIPKIDHIINPDKKEQLRVLKALKKKKLKGAERDKELFALYDEDQRLYNKLSELAADGDTLISEKLYESYDEMARFHSDPQFISWLEKSIKKVNYDVYVTGTSTVFALGTNYMINDMIESLILAIITISALMFFLFTSARMIIISLVPNIIPQILIAGVMGWFNIPIKPSTILVFSIAYGISVDNSIHFLAKYRQELRAQHFNIRSCVSVALRETFLSQVYTSIVLLLGFSMFCFSEFGGTVALGLLVSLSLFIAMFCNLILLPALLMTLDRYIAIKAFEEPFLSIYDEEEDIDLNQLEIDFKDEFSDDNPPK